MKTAGAVHVAIHAPRHLRPHFHAYSSRIGVRIMAWYAAIAASAMASDEPINRRREWRCTAPTKRAIESSQNARKGRSASSELPLMTKGGGARNRSGGENGQGG